VHISDIKRVGVCWCGNTQKTNTEFIMVSELGFASPPVLDGAVVLPLTQRLFAATLGSASCSVLLPLSVPPWPPPATIVSSLAASKSEGRAKSAGRPKLSSRPLSRASSSSPRSVVAAACSVPSTLQPNSPA
jgi:hypothetical protein